MMMMMMMVVVMKRLGMTESQSSRHMVEWSPNVNYTDWSIHHHFYLGDSLYFVSNNSNYKVLEVSKTNYKNCITGEKKMKKSNELEIVKLMEARPYYFITAKDYCIHGMKLSLSVQIQNIPPNPQPSSDPQTDDSPPGLTRWITFLIVVSMAETYICIHNLRRRRW
ncbi:unnamed protein product [Camellia sinensis]